MQTETLQRFEMLEHLPIHSPAQRENKKQKKLLRVTPPTAQPKTRTAWEQVKSEYFLTALILRT